jgi:hypothetical protein
VDETDFARVPKVQVRSSRFFITAEDYNFELVETGEVFLVDLAFKLELMVPNTHNI